MQVVTDLTFSIAMYIKVKLIIGEKKIRKEHVYINQLYLNATLR